MSGNRMSRVRGACAAALGAAGLLIVPGCLTTAPLAPHATVVYAPHPAQADEALPLEELKEIYSASGDPDPDGLGPLDWIWEQSYFTLVVPALARKFEERARIAYSRTDDEQARALREDEAARSTSVEFTGVLIGDFAELLDLDVYKPEGIFLIDDQGRKHYPWFAFNLDPVLPPIELGEFGASHWAYPRLLFHAEAIGPHTRSVSLYLATAERRIRFTWVFDPGYRAPGAQEEPGGPRKRRVLRRN